MDVHHHGVPTEICNRVLQVRWRQHAGQLQDTFGKHADRKIRPSKISARIVTTNTEKLQ